MPRFEPSLLALGQTLRRLNAADLFGYIPDAAVEAARLRVQRRLARRRRHEAVEPFLREPWTAWSGSGDAARLARRFLRRYPGRDFALDDGLRTGRQAAAEYHRDEESAEMAYEPSETARR